MKIQTVKIKDPNHPNGEIIVNADDPRANKPAEPKVEKKSKRTYTKRQK